MFKVSRKVKFTLLGLLLMAPTCPSAMLAQAALADTCGTVPCSAETPAPTPVPTETPKPNCTAETCLGEGVSINPVLWLPHVKQPPVLVVNEEQKQGEFCQAWESYGGICIVSE